MSVIVMLSYYLRKLNYNEIPEFLVKYLESPSLIRLKKISYLCGMEYSSKEIYNIEKFISRYDHSLTVSLITWLLTGDKKATIAALVHDVSTPCFSHVVDFMNADYEKQESTEEFTEFILKNDDYFMECLKKDNIDLSDIVNYKKYTIVDNNRPKVCADRIDGVILTGISWTKNITKEDIDLIVDDMYVVKNEENEKEISFKTLSVAQKVIDISKSIDVYCHSRENFYLMKLLGDMTKLAIDRKYIKYEDLFYLNEEELFNIFYNKNDKDLLEILNEFKTVKINEIPSINIPKIKIRSLKPLVNGVRMLAC